MIVQKVTVEPIVKTMFSKKTVFLHDDVLIFLFSIITNCFRERFKSDAKCIDQLTQGCSCSCSGDCVLSKQGFELLSKAP